MRRVYTDSAISDHKAVVATFEAMAPLHFQAVEVFPKLTPPTDWDRKWAEVWETKEAEWGHSISAGNTEEAWRVWSDALEESTGLDKRLCRRHLGTVLTQQERVWRGPEGSRQPVAVRRLLRIQRRLHELQEQLECGRANEDLLRAYHRNLDNIGDLDIGHIDTTTDWDEADRLISRKIDKILNEQTKERVRQCQEEQNSGYMQSIFENIGGKPMGMHTAVVDSDGKLTAKPEHIFAGAVRQWKKKQHEELDDGLSREYGAAVMPTIAAVHPGEGVENTFTIKELRAALRATRGTVAGPGQFPAELLSQAPEDAIHKMCHLAVAICAKGEWPYPLRIQEMVMIPKRASPGTSGPSA